MEVKISYKLRKGERQAWLSNGINITAVPKNTQDHTAAHGTQAGLREAGEKLLRQSGEDRGSGHESLYSDYQVKLYLNYQRKHAEKKKQE